MADPAQPRQPVGKRVAKPAGAIALILAGVYAAEGGFSNDPHDPGGATNYGVTQQIARQYGYTGDMRVFPKHCNGSASVCADAVYVESYIERPGYMPLISIEPAIAAKLVDTAVNMGPLRPNKWFRESLGLPASVTPLGPEDYLAYQARGNCEVTLRFLGRRQEAEYLRLISRNPKLGKFRNGWLARARNLHPSGVPCGAAS